MVRISLFSTIVIISQVTANGDFPGFLGFPNDGISRSSSYSSSSVSVRGADGKMHTESQELRDEGINDGSGPRHARAAVACKDFLCKGRLQRQTPDEGVTNSQTMTFQGKGGGLAPEDEELGSNVRMPGAMDFPRMSVPNMGINMGLGMDEDDDMGMGRDAEDAAFASPFLEAGRIAQGLEHMGNMMRNLDQSDPASGSHAASVSSSYAYARNGDEERAAAQITRCKDGACETKTLKTPQDASKSSAERTADGEAKQTDASKVKAEQPAEAKDKMTV